MPCSRDVLVSTLLGCHDPMLSHTNCRTNSLWSFRDVVPVLMPCRARWFGHMKGGNPDAYVTIQSLALYDFYEYQLLLLLLLRRDWPRKKPSNKDKISLINQDR